MNDSFDYFIKVLLKLNYTFVNYLLVIEHVLSRWLFGMQVELFKFYE